MGLQISDYYAQVDLGISQARAVYEAVDVERQKVSNPDLDPARNWSDTLFQIQAIINQLYLMAGIAQFERTTKDRMRALLTAAAQGLSSGKVTIAITHELSDLDTLRSLELQYGVPWTQILDFNAMTISDFEAASSVQIPMAVELQQPGNQDIPVFGDQTDVNILGTDLTPDLDAGDDGDLLAQDPVTSFQQWVDTVSVSEKGDFPFYEDFGTNLDLSEDLPRAALDSMIQLRISEAFSVDPRITDVQLIDISHDGNTVTATTRIQTIQGQQFETTT